jgi:hypothetical protein
MTHHQKVNHFLRSLPKPRLWPPAAPLGYRFLWRLGVPLPPPHFLPARAHLVGTATVLILLLSAFLHVRPLRPEQGFGLRDVTVILGIALPIAILQAIIYPRSARRLGLIAWHEYPGPGSGLAIAPAGTQPTAHKMRRS